MTADDFLTNRFLDLRCEIAHARAMLQADPAAAYRRAERVFAKVVSETFDGDWINEGIPWPIRGEPALEFAFRRGCALAQERLAAHDSFLRESQEREERLIAYRKDCDLSWPSAAELLAQLNEGKRVELNGHSLEHAREFGGEFGRSILCGTNAYGVDYCWGQMTLASVSSWREAMVRGEDIGDTPPIASDEEYEADQLDTLERPVLDAYKSLSNMKGMKFDERLVGLINVVVVDE